MDEHLERHCHNVLDAARDGEIVFFLGAGVNLCGRPRGARWKKAAPTCRQGRSSPTTWPTSSVYRPGERPDLARVAQYVSAERGLGKLSGSCASCSRWSAPPPGSTACSLNWPGCSLPRRSSIPTSSSSPPITTTCSSGPSEAGMPFDLLVYITHGEDRGRLRPCRTRRADDHHRAQQGRRAGYAADGDREDPRRHGSPGRRA